MRPRSERNAAASAASSWAISSSILAHTATAAVSRAREKCGQPGGFGRAVKTRGRLAALRELRLVQVDHDEQRFGGQKLKAPEPLQIVAFEIERPERLAILERRPAQHDDVAFSFEIRGLRFLEILFEAFQTPLCDAQVGEDQLILHRLRVARGVDGAGRMRDRWIVECAENVNKRVGVLVRGDVHECLGPARSARRREIRELDCRGDAFARVVHPRQAVEP